MGSIEEIIDALDNELIETGKHYLLLGESNKLLLKNGLISQEEYSNKAFKKLLENNAIPHAYQTNTSPKQWRIPPTKEGLKVKKMLSKNTTKKTTSKEKKVKAKSYDNSFSQTKFFLLFFSVIFIIVWLVLPNSNETKEIVRNNSGDSSVYQVVDYLKRNLKDPDSYQPIEWSKVVKISEYEYRVRHKYRAKNSFGGYVIEEKIFSLDEKGNINRYMDVE